MRIVLSRKALYFVAFWVLFLQPLYAYTVLWDTSHFVYTGYDPSTPGGYYEPLSSDLADNGFTIQTSSTGFDSDAQLATSDVAVICAATSKYFDYNTAEINALTSFVNGGGGLLVMADYDPLNIYGYQSVLSAFGISLGSWISTTNPSGSLHVVTGELTDHPVFDGVDDIHMYNALEMTVSGSAQSIAQVTNSGGQQVDIIASLVYGQGRVIVLSDADIWSVATTNYYGLADNQQLAMNTFEHLVDTDYVPEPATLALLLVGAVLLRLRVK